MRPSAGTSERQGYAVALAGLWTRLSHTLASLEEIAADPEGALAEEAAHESLPQLQYALHTASELALGLTPPAGAETAHAELAASLADARDATAEVAETVEELGVDAALPLVLEWRGALFRVRLARMRLRTPSPPPAHRAEPRPDVATAALVAALLVLAGAAAFVSGAVLGAWPLWTFGLTLVIGGVAAYRP